MLRSIARLNTCAWNLPAFYFSARWRPGIIYHVRNSELIIYPVSLLDATGRQRGISVGFVVEDNGLQAIK